MVGPRMNSDGTPDELESLRPGMQPMRLYASGIVFPRQLSASDEDDKEAAQRGADEAAQGEKAQPIIKTKKGRESSTSIQDDFEANRANDFKPSALGISCMIIPNPGIIIAVKGATYSRITPKPAEGKGARQYVRKPFKLELTLTTDHISQLTKARVLRWPEQTILIEGSRASASIHLYLRKPDPRATGGNSSVMLLTATLLNDTKHDDSADDNESCIYQAGISVESPQGLNCVLPYYEPEAQGDDETKSLSLLYRNQRSYAMGHGCAAEWDTPSADGSCAKAWSETMPRFELPPTVPSQLEGVPLLMAEMAKDVNVAIASCNKLCDRYKSWIDGISKEAAKLPEQYKETAERHIAACLEVLRRMKAGVMMLKDTNCSEAFKWANQAMYDQQIHYKISTDSRRDWKGQTNGNLTLEPFVMPDFAAQGVKIGEWRPFQLAFILMNIEGIVNDTSPDRDVVDLIWFPTGGGKTEAYLGLTAFGIFHRRLTKPESTGTYALMRYTLRLLTTQQFLRASSLICACELIRRTGDNSTRLGTSPISIGLWVGGSVTPNDFKGARATYNNLTRSSQTSESFVINSCPWCGAQMGKVTAPGLPTQIKGYESTTKKFSFFCPDATCSFKDKLPLQVVDEGLYESPPTLLIGTVDKFAGLAWNQDALSIFGAGKKQTDTPTLIIQDELHLISGPLGSMVGLFEASIDALCQHSGKKPKIVASTATISRAESQILGLYNRQAAVFPPQGIDISDSFFAKEMKIAATDDPKTEVRGRAYVGIFGSARSSQLMTQVMLTAGLLQAAKSCGASPKYVDPYFTIIQYYNSLRELGQAAATVDSELKEHSTDIRSRLGLGKVEEGMPDQRRYVNKCIELASFIPSHEINDVLQQLFSRISDDEKFLESRRAALPDEKLPADICFATNMIQVGLDVPRLGLMSVVGQPKGTAEYIQTTSRVGRSKDAPGLVFTTYNPSKPRDRSHYEHFKSYHQSLYRWVEPTCVTPFSLPTRERALHAIVVILVRLFLKNEITDIPPAQVPDEIQLRISNWVLDRIETIDPSERKQAEAMLTEIFDKWARIGAHQWGKMHMDEFKKDNIPLLAASGSNVDAEYEAMPFMTPTSMRNVDATCEAYVI